jgi:hypothetical protein
MVTILSTVYGNKPQEQTEFLCLTCNGKTRQIAAYNKGNGYIKLFSLQNFINFYHLNKEYSSFDITLDEYNDDTALENIIKETFFSNSLNFN